MFRGRIAFGLSMVLWGRSILGRQKVPLEGLSKGFGILGIHTTGARMAPNLPFADLSKREKNNPMEQNHWKLQPWRFFVTLLSPSYVGGHLNFEKLTLPSQKGSLWITWTASFGGFAFCGDDVQRQGASLQWFRVLQKLKYKKMRRDFNDIVFGLCFHMCVISYLLVISCYILFSLNIQTPPNKVFLGP